MKKKQQLVLSIRQFMEQEARSGSIDYGSITPEYIYMMLRNNVSLNDIEEAMAEIRKSIIYLKRTFHPVGQGAFFTEQFFDAEMHKVLYNVVYDCGSRSAGIKTQLERDIRNCFHDRKHIDVLFLSHFDDDHVNKVDYLKKEGYLQGTRIFIPMVLDEDRLGIEPYKTNYQFVLSLNDKGVNGTKVILVERDESNADNTAPINTSEPQVIEDLDGNKTIKSGTTLKPKDNLIGELWRYTLVNVQFNELIDEFKQRLEDSNPPLEYNKLDDVNYVEENISTLRKVYQGLGKKPNDGTAINLNSLLVMSYPVDAQKCYYAGYRNMYDRNVDCQYKRKIGYTGSCLYTGDTSANEMFVWSRIDSMIKECLGSESKLTMLQVPHHGSKYSYDEKLVNSDRYLNGFTNYDPYYSQHIFDDSLPMKFASKNIMLVLVTREYGSQYEEYWMVR